MNRYVKPMEMSEVRLMVDYFLSSGEDFLRGMGADPRKLPRADEWIRRIEEDLSRPLPSRQLYYLTWMADDRPIGHSNINRIVFAREAFVHLHIWRLEDRRSKSAEHYLAQSVARYFELFRLDRLCCEPFALNPAPNRVLPKVGFRLVRSYETTPGPINFHQRVNRWELERPAHLKIGPGS